MPSRRVVAGIAAAMIAVAGGAYLLHDDTGIAPGMEGAPTRTPPPTPAMVPWRNPTSDTHAFFPGARVPDASSPTVVPLSRQRAAVQQRLGADTPLDSNALYVFRVGAEGSILLRRAAGEYGAIEVVLGIGSDGRARGVRLQRHREPPVVASALSERWLAAFRGRTATDDFTVGRSLPAVPPAAVRSATAVARAVRALLIEYDAGTHP